MAEPHHVEVVPHNPLSRVSAAACIPNFALYEYPSAEGESPKSEIVAGVLTLEDGYLIIPDAPGIGVELREGAMVTHLHANGSVGDQ